MNETLTLPVLPLRDTVVFPGVTTPIGAGRPATLKAIQAASNRKDKLVFAVSQRENVEKVTPERLHTIGTVARIGQLQRVTGGVQFLLQGEFRGIALRISEAGTHLHAVVRKAEEMSPTDVADTAFLGLQREVKERAAELGRKAGFPDEVVEQALSNADEPGRLADLVASYLEIPFAELQMLLETLVGRRAVAPGATARAATDRGARRPTGHQVAGAAGARGPTAGDGPTRAAQSDSGGAG